MYDLLKGVRVLDLTTVVLGPFATRYLGDFGADVIKVEPPGGDIFRNTQAARSAGMGAGHLNLNRNKQSVCLDLKREEHRTRFSRLLADADVLVHNMRPAAVRRLGLDHAEVRTRHPHLVYCVSTGYGSRGRNADLPAYDDIIQAAAGIAHLNRDGTGQPRFLPSILCDKIGGLHLALAVLAGVTKQAQTGEGCYIEAPMFEGLVSFLLAEHLNGETFRPAIGPMGYERLLSPYRRPFATRDGYLAVMPYNSTHWQRFLTLAGRSDLAGAPWVSSPSERSARIGELYAVVAEELPGNTTEHWLKKLREHDIPCTPVNSLEDLLEDPHLADVGLFQEIDHPGEGRLRSVKAPFWVEGSETFTDTPAPELPEPGGTASWPDRPETGSFGRRSRE